VSGAVDEAMRGALQHHRAGRLSEAEALYRRILAVAPNHAGALHFLGVLAWQRGHAAEAVALIGRAIAARPDWAEAHSNLANALLALDRRDEAIASCRRAIALNPSLAGALNNLSGLLTSWGDTAWDEAIELARRAVRIDPNYINGYVTLGSRLNGAGEVAEAIQMYRRSVELAPARADLHAKLLLPCHYDASQSAREVYEEHLCWADRHAAPLSASARPHDNDRTPERTLRVGYVSPDFRDHPVAYFMLPLLQAHSRPAFHVVCYSTGATEDSITALCRAHADEWKTLTGMTDDAAAELIRRDRIDILVDLAGHTADGRLLMMARKPAPVQVSYLGYPGTTGVSAMDYRLTDELADPRGQTEALYVEELVRLSRTLACYQPPPQAPPVSDLPALRPGREGRVSFASFSSLSKISAQTLRMWAAVLARVPGSRMVVTSHGAGASVFTNRINEALAAAGVEQSRVEVRPAGPMDKYLEFHADVDIVLDTFPFNGHTTLCHALWMGVPAVSLAGDRFASRLGLSVLTNVGLPQLAADTEQRYVDAADAWAGDLPALAELRHGLRQRMRRSPLMDSAGFALDVEAAYRQMWRRFCEAARA
jgi:protein O-GlcNAc transferase